eukprot:403367793
MSLAQDGNEDRFSHAVFSYPQGKYESLNQELRTFLETELGSYKPIIIQEKADVPQAKIEYIEKSTGEVGETSFPNYFPVDLLKQMLKGNGMLLKDAKSTDL